MLLLARLELLRLVRQPAAMALLLVLAIAGVAAVSNGVAVVKRIEAATDARRPLARAAYARQIAEFDSAKSPAEREVNVFNLAGWGEIPVLTLASSAPLAVSGIEQRALAPRISVWTSPTDLLPGEEFSNPAARLVSSFDPMFVIVVLAPLVLLALTFDLLATDRASGTFPLLAAQPGALGRVLLVRAIVRAGAVLTVVAVPVAVALALLRLDAAPTTFPMVAVVASIVAVCASYLAAWTGLAVCVNAGARSPQRTALALIAAWLLLIVIVPSAVDSVAAARIPAPSRLLLLAAAQESATKAERDPRAAAVALLARRPDLHALRPHGDTAIRSELESMAWAEATNVQVQPLVDSLEAAWRARYAVQDWAAVATPSLVVRRAIESLAWTDPATLEGYRHELRRFHRAWMERFFPLAVTGRGVTRADFVSRLTLPEVPAVALTTPWPTVRRAILVTLAIGMLFAGLGLRNVRYA